MPKIQYNVQVRLFASSEWVTRRTHDSYREAVGYCDAVARVERVSTRVVIAATGCPDEDAWRYAVAAQGFTGSFASWQSMDDGERYAYEVGAGASGA